MRRERGGERAKERGINDREEGVYIGSSHLGVMQCEGCSVKDKQNTQRQSALHLQVSNTYADEIVDS